MKLKQSTTVHKELRLSYYEQKRERLLGFLGVLHRQRVVVGKKQQHSLINAGESPVPGMVLCRDVNMIAGTATGQTSSQCLNVCSKEEASPGVRRRGLASKQEVWYFFLLRLFRSIAAQRR